MLFPSRPRVFRQHFHQFRAQSHRKRRGKFLLTKRSLPRYKKKSKLVDRFEFCAEIKLSLLEINLSLCQLFFAESIDLRKNACLFPDWLHQG